MSVQRARTVRKQIVDEVLTATRALIAVSTTSLGDLAQELSTAQYRTLVVLASRGSQRMVDLALQLRVNPSTVGRMCDRLVRKGFVERNRADTDRRTVVVSLTAAGRQVLDEATARRRLVIEQMLAELTEDQQYAVAAAMRALAHTTGEIPDELWPTAPESPDTP